MNKEHSPRQQAFDWITEMEGLGFNLTAMRESIASKDGGEFVIDPSKMVGHLLEPQSPGDSFSPELIVEGMPEVVVFEG